MTNHATNDRYTGQPMLRLLDSYVFDLMGQLDPQTSEALVQIEPKLRSVYNRSGTWREITAGVLALNEDFNTAVKTRWADHQAAARREGRSVDAVLFGRSLVDAYLALDD